MVRVSDTGANGARFCPQRRSLPTAPPAAAAFWHSPNCSPPRVAELRAAVHAIRAVDPDFLPQPSFAQIEATAQPAPLIYLLATPAGGLALVVRPDDVQPVWLDVREDDLNGWLVRYEGEEVAGGYLPAQLGFGVLTDELSTLLPALGDKVLQPIAEALAPPLPETGDAGIRPRVTLIPIGRMSLLPLHAARYSRERPTTHLHGRVRRRLRALGPGPAHRPATGRGPPAGAATPGRRRQSQNRGPQPGLRQSGGRRHRRASAHRQDHLLLRSQCHQRRHMDGAARRHDRALRLPRAVQRRCAARLGPAPGQWRPIDRPRPHPR